MLLEAGTGNANRNYLLVGGISGTIPGTPLPGGQATLPINWDRFSDLKMMLLGSSVFSGFWGALDAQGEAKARLNSPPVPGVAGVILHFAYCCDKPFDVVSNPVAIEVIP